MLSELVSSCRDHGGECVVTEPGTHEYQTVSTIYPLKIGTMSCAFVTTNQVGSSRLHQAQLFGIMTPRTKHIVVAQAGITSVMCHEL